MAYYKLLEQSHTLSCMGLHYAVYIPNPNYPIGEGIIAAFYSEKDAILFVREYNRTLENDI